jgi:hypothetical protein
MIKINTPLNPPYFNREKFNYLKDRIESFFLAMMPICGM